jgi:hypothetical protein
LYSRVTISPICSFIGGKLISNVIPLGLITKLNKKTKWGKKRSKIKKKEEEIIQF